MARTNNLTDFLTDVSNSIKLKIGDNTPIPAANFDAEILNLPSQGVYQDKSITISINGNTTVLPNTGYDAIEELSVTTNVVDSEYSANLALSNVILDNPEFPYTRLEYIESTGTQYIDTDVINMGTLEFEIDFLTYNDTIYTSGEFGCIFGARTYWFTDGYQLTTYTKSPITNGHFLYGTVSSSSAVNNIRYEAKMTKGVRCTMAYKNGLFTRGDDSVVNIAKKTFTGTDTLYIFALSELGVASEFSKCRLYSFKLYNNGTIIRNFVPVRKNTGEVCLYDEVTSQFYINQGTGVFIAGPVKID